MAINSLNAADKTNWPEGATGLLAEGKSSTGFYTYPSTLDSGIYAIKSTALVREANNATVTFTANAQAATVANGGTTYFNLTTTETSLILQPKGAVPQTYNAKTGAKNFSTQQIAYANGIFIASVADGTKRVATATDPDGPWTFVSISTPTTAAVSNIVAAYLNNKYIANVGSYLAHSTDAVTWSTTNIYGNINIEPEQIRYENGLYLLAGERSKLATSTDLITWTNVSGTGNASTSSFTNWFYNGTYLLSGTSGKIETSTDGIGWITQSGQLTQQQSTAIYGDKWVLAGSTGTLQTSTDTITWTSRTSSFGTSAINGIGYNGSNLYVIGGAGGTAASSTDAITWTVISPNFGTSAINAVKYLNGLWVAGGAGGRLTTSTDAVTWTAQTSGFGTSAITNSAYGNGLYIIAGGFGKIATSTDAVTWTLQTSGVTTAWNDVTYYNGYYLVAGASGAIRSSTDAVTWTAVTSGTTGAIYRFAIGSGKVIATATAGTVISSTDGVTWVNEGTKVAGSVRTFFDFRYLNGSYVVVEQSSNSVFLSTNLVTWTAYQNGTLPFAPRSILYGNGRYTTVGPTGRISTSTDLVTWSDTTIGTADFVSVDYVGNLYIAVGTTTAAYSTDNITWTTGNVDATISTMYDVVKMPSGNFYAGSADLDLVMSTNGITWEHGYGYGNVVDIVYGNGTFAAANGRAISLSTNGNSWTTYDSGLNTNFSGLAYAQGAGYLSTNTGNVSTSTDGITWATLTGVANAVGRPAVGRIGTVNLYYVGLFGTNASNIQFSTTGSSFFVASVTTSATQFVRSLGFYNGFAFAGLSGGTISYSTTTNGTTWTEISPSATSGMSIHAIGGGNGYFYAAGTGGNVVLSTNLVTWTAYNVGHTSTIRNVLAVDNVWIAVAENGYYSQSTDGITWSSAQIGTTVIPAVAGYNASYLLATETNIYKGNASYPMFYSIYSVNPGEIA